MGFYVQKVSQTAPVSNVSVDDLEIGKDEDVINIKGTKVLLNSIGFYCGERNGCILIGNYQEWLELESQLCQQNRRKRQCLKNSNLLSENSGGGTNPHYYKKGGRYRLGVATPKREEVDACSIHCDKLC